MLGCLPSHWCLIAQAVDVTPVELEEAGRPDAARRLRDTHTFSGEQPADELELAHGSAVAAHPVHQIADAAHRSMAREAEEEQQTKL